MRATAQKEKRATASPPRATVQKATMHDDTPTMLTRQKRRTSVQGEEKKKKPKNRSKRVLKRENMSQHIRNR